MLGLIFTLVLTYGGALVSLIEPFIGVLIYICFGILKPDTFWYWSVPSSNYSQIVAIALLIGWVFRSLGDLKLGSSRTILVFLSLYLIWQAVSGLLSENRAIALYNIGIIAKIALIYFVGLTLIGTMTRTKLLAWVIVATQGYAALELNLSYLRGYNRLWIDGMANVDNNSYAISLVTCLPIAFFLGLHSKNLFAKTIAFCFAGAMAHAVLFSFSRGGMLGMLVVGFMTFILIPKKPAHYLLLVLALGVTIRLAGPEVRSRFRSSFEDTKNLDTSAKSRLALWNNCLSIMAQNPVFGIGPGQFSLIADKYGWPEGKEAHTLWLQTGAEIGIPGLAFLLLFYSTCAWRLWKFARLRKFENSWESITARMVLCSLSGFMVSAQFVSLYRLETPYYVSLLGIAMLKIREFAPAGNETKATMPELQAAMPAEQKSDS
jgi:putative inorganic carbon (hco3(-)) transporter